MTGRAGKGMLLGFMFVLVAIIFTLPIFAHPDYWGIQDWDGFLLFDALIRTSYLKYHQIPLWNPYLKGGMPMLAYAESNIFSPALLVQLFFNEIWAAKINILLHVVIGLGGAYRLARHFRLERQASLLTASVFMLNSMYSLPLTAGMEWGYGIPYLPWAFLFYLKSFENYRNTLAASLFLAIMWLGGGVYPFTITLLLLGTHGLVSCISKELPLKQTLTVLSVIYGLTFALGAIKFLPALEFAHRYTRHDDLYSGLSLESMIHGLFGHDQTLAAIIGKARTTGFRRGYSQGMDETGMYLGIIPFALFLLSAVSKYRKYLTLLICLAIFVWLGTGDRSAPFSLWHLLREIPPYSMMRSVERFRFVTVLLIALMAGAGLQTLGEYVSRKSPARSGFFRAVILLFVLCDLLWVNGKTFRDAFTIPPIEIPANEAFVQIGGLPEYDRNGPRYSGEHDLYTSFGAAYPAFLANAGSVYAYESMPVPENAVIIGSPEYRGEVFLEGTSGAAVYSYWSPNHLEIEVRAAGSGMLIINQNFYPGWRARGLQPEALRGLLAVPVNPQIHRVELTYRPTSFIIGSIITLLTMIGMSGWLFISRKGTGKFPLPVRKD